MREADIESAYDISVDAWIVRATIPCNAMSSDKMGSVIIRPLIELVALYLKSHAISGSGCEYGVEVFTFEAKK